MSVAQQPHASTAAPLGAAHDNGHGAFVTTPITDSFAAQITDIDLREPISASTQAAIEEALVEHHVLVFRDQDLDAQQQNDFTLNFGEIESHVIRRRDGGRTPLVHVISNLDEAGKPTLKPHSFGNYYWHTDKSYHDIPSFA
ncbi:MAG: alpha-ketoglutarate-dependent taurine dioxygenase, partial [Gammaproteobacteria bacterium]